MSDVADSGFDRFADWDAAYVLGALSPQERRDFETHLRGCARCSAAVTELAGMPSLLGRLPADTVPSTDRPSGRPELPPLPDTMLASLIGQVQRTRRRRRRIAVAVGALAVAAAAVAVLVIAPWTPRASAPRPVALDQVVASPVHAQIRLVSEHWGTRVEVMCHYDRPAPPNSAPETDPRAGEVYDYTLRITDRSGHSFSAAWWSERSGESTADPTASVKLPIAQIARVQVLGEDDRVLLQLDR
ncbi:putative zinc finger protein [Jatrophihabitans sp. GAS493]|uniref:anti-sigma factor family protein n=1 Tax=Jatrophihabitans sp. GAS493 TaxID=1907575 RepID=UPI000BB762CF|nr:zf-HC2 domain-containing protein [Jatrophihabitans sp. GAS493]SOD70690.1 putative zinc finger protein [Jatrophihabitans sp. GAS493]